MEIKCIKDQFNLLMENITDGFQDDFMYVDIFLVTLDPKGGICRNSAGNISLEYNYGHDIPYYHHEKWDGTGGEDVFQRGEIIIEFS